MKDQIATLTTKQLVKLNNTLNPELPVTKFKSTEAGIDKVTALIESKNKGKNKALFFTLIAGLPVEIITTLAPGITMARELITKLLPAQIAVLAKFKEMGANEAHVEKEAFHSAFGVDATDAKLASVLECLYKNNFLIWEQDDTMMISEAASRFIDANPDLVDKETMFADLKFELVKEKKAKANGDLSKSRVKDSSLITPLITDNPCQPAKRRHGMYAIWLGKTGADRITVGGYKEQGGILFDLTDAVKLGRAAIQDPSDAEVIPAPKVEVAPVAPVAAVAAE